MKVPCILDLKPDRVNSESGIVAKSGCHVKTKGYSVLVVAGTISFDGDVGATGTSKDLFGNGALTGASTGGAGAEAGGGAAVDLDIGGGTAPVTCGCGLFFAFLSLEYPISETISSNNLP